MRRRCLTALLAGAFLLRGWSTVRADIQAPPARGRGRANEPAVTTRGRPASAVEVSSQTPLGGSVEITLRARGQLGKNVSFLLRDPPLHGTVSEPLPTGRDTAVVTYTHRAADGPAPDNFTYAVQAPDTAVSATAAVEVRILDDPPRVAVVETPPELDFGAVLPGVEVRRELMLENRGGGLATGTLTPPDPWQVEGGTGAASYRLGREERQAFTLIFKPGTARTFSGQVVLGPASDQVARLAGVGLQADGSVPPAVSAPGLENVESGSRAANAPAGPVLAKDSARVADQRPPFPPAMPPSQMPDSAPADRQAFSGAASLPYSPLEVPLLPDDGEAPVKNLALQARGPHTLTVSWPVPKPMPTGYRVELRRFWIDDDQQLQSQWNTYPSVAIQPGPENTVQATLRALPAGVPQTLRVIALDGRGTLSPPSTPLQAATLPVRSWWTFATPLRVLLAGLGVCLILLLRRPRPATAGW